MPDVRDIAAGDLNEAVKAEETAQEVHDAACGRIVTALTVDLSYETFDEEEFERLNAHRRATLKSLREAQARTKRLKRLVLG